MRTSHEEIRQDVQENLFINIVQCILVGIALAYITANGIIGKGLIWAE